MSTVGPANAAPCAATVSPVAASTRVRGHVRSARVGPVATSTRAFCRACVTSTRPKRRPRTSFMAGVDVLDHAAGEDPHSGRRVPGDGLGDLVEGVQAAGRRSSTTSAPLSSAASRSCDA